MKVIPYDGAAYRDGRSSSFLFSNPLLSCIVGGGHAFGQRGVNRVKQESRRRVLRWWWLAALVVVLAGVIAWRMWPRTPVVHVTRVERQTMSNRVFATGTVRPTQRQVVMASSLPAPIEQIRVNPGDHVRKGQVLLTCQNETQLAALEAARTAVQNAQQTYDQAKQQYNSVPPGLQPQFKGTMDQASTALAQAKVQLSQAQAAYDATIVRAQFAGTVIDVNPSGIASDGTAAAVVEVVGPVKQVVTSISEVDAVHIHSGMTATLSSDAYPNRTWRGTVERVAEFATTAQSGSGQVEVDVSTPPNFPLPDGYQVDLRIASATRQRVTVVPYDALVQSGGGYAVYVYHDGRVHKVGVKLGLTSDIQVEVTHGVRPGNEVVVNPPSYLRDGEAVRVQ
jgi:RND family efflux transporter MFP subunit